jgi:hypothetical protein
LDKSLKAAKKNAVKNTVPDEDDEDSDEVEDLEDEDDSDLGNDIGQIDLDAEDGEDEDLDSDD